MDLLLAGKLLSILILSLVLNLPLGMWRSSTKKFSLAWFVSVHLAVPLIYFLRIQNGFSSWTIILFITFAVLGQMAGGKMLEHCSKKTRMIPKES